MYRRNVFQWVRMEILDESTLIMLQCDKTSDSHIYTLTKFQHLERKWIVVVYNEKVNISCSCKMMEFTSIPCRHIFYVMKFDQLVRIPLNLILARCIKSTNVSTMMKMTAAALSIDKEVSKIAKFGSLIDVIIFVFSS